MTIAILFYRNYLSLYFAVIFFACGEYLTTTNSRNHLINLQEIDPISWFRWSGTSAKSASLRSRSRRLVAAINALFLFRPNRSRKTPRASHTDRPPSLVPSTSQCSRRRSTPWRRCSITLAEPTRTGSVWAPERSSPRKMKCSRTVASSRR
jgi:hypothetical protein